MANSHFKLLSLSPQYCPGPEHVMVLPAHWIARGLPLRNPTALYSVHRMASAVMLLRQKNTSRTVQSRRSEILLFLRSSHIRRSDTIRHRNEALTAIGTRGRLRTLFRTERRACRARRASRVAESHRA